MAPVELIVSRIPLAFGNGNRFGSLMSSAGPAKTTAAMPSTLSVRTHGNRKPRNEVFICIFLQSDGVCVVGSATLEHLGYQTQADRMTLGFHQHVKPTAREVQSTSLSLSILNLLTEIRSK